MMNPPNATPLLRLFLLALLALPLGAVQARAEPQAARQTITLTRPTAVPVVFGFSFKKFFTGSAGRSRVIQIGTVVMCLALFILMRKHN
jgi:hypothetical protein